MVTVETTEDLKKYPEADLVVNYITNRKKQGLYSLILIAGLPGTGKTSECCRLGEKTSIKLTGENNFTSACIGDNFLHFLKFVKQAKPEEVNIYVMEEISVLFPSRRAMSGDNVDLAKVLDTCRKKQVIIFANAPIWTQIDSHMRSMANVYIQTIRVYKKAGIVYSKFYRLQTDPRTGKTYTKNFHRNNRDVNRMYTLMPNLEMWNEYESMKDTFLDLIYSKAEARAFDRNAKEEKLINKMKPNDINSFTAQEMFVHNEVTLKGRSQSEVAKDLDVTQGRVSQLITKINKKKEISNVEN